MIKADSGIRGQRWLSAVAPTRQAPVGLKADLQRGANRRPGGRSHAQGPLSGLIVVPANEHVGCAVRTWSVCAAPRLPGAHGAPYGLGRFRPER